MSANSKGPFLIIGEESYQLNPTTTRIGRKLDNDIVIHDLRVSRYHAEISKMGETYFIHDLNSTSGTFVNDQKVIETVLTNGDKITLSATEIIFSNSLDSIETKKRSTKMADLLNSNFPTTSLENPETPSE